MPTTPRSAVPFLQHLVLLPPFCPLSVDCSACRFGLRYAPAAHALPHYYAPHGLAASTVNTFQVAHLPPARSVLPLIRGAGGNARATHRLPPTCHLPIPTFLPVSYAATPLLPWHYTYTLRYSAHVPRGLLCHTFTRYHPRHYHTRTRAGQARLRCRRATPLLCLYRTLNT